MGNKSRLTAGKLVCVLELYLEKGGVCLVLKIYRYIYIYTKKSYSSIGPLKYLGTLLTMFSLLKAKHVQVLR